MSKQVTVTLDEAALRAFLQVAERCSQMLGNTSCDDLPLADTPENRALSERLMAEQWYGISVEEWRESGEYHAPELHQGQIYVQGRTVLDDVTETLREAAEARLEVAA